MVICTKQAELIFLCSNPSLSSNQKDKIRILLEFSFDWEEFILKVNLLGVSLLIYHNLKNYFSDKVPYFVLKKMQAFFIKNVAKNMVLSRSLLDLLQLLKKENIIGVPFKGPVLSGQLYGDDFFRFFNDLDIFVRSSDLSKTIKILTSNGYITKQTIIPKNEPRHLKLDHALDFVHSQTNINIDLQWKLFRIYTLSSLTLERMEERLVTIDFQGKQVLSLSPEDLFFFLCCHATKHHWVSLEYVVSISEIIRTEKTLNLEYIIALAKKEGCLRMVLLGLNLAETIYEAPIDGLFKSMIEKDHIVIELTDQIIDSYITNSNISSNFTNNIDLSWFQIKVRDNLRAKIYFAIRALTRPSYQELNMVRLPFPFYFIFKPIRLVMKLIIHFGLSKK